MRLTLRYLAIFFLAEVVFGAGIWSLLRENLFDIADTNLDGQAADLQRLLEARKELPATQLQAAIAENYKIERSRDCLQISDGKSNSIYRSRFLEEHPLPPLSLEDLDRPFYQNRKLGDQRFRVRSEQIEVSGRAYVVSVAHSMREESEALDALRGYLLWFALFLLLVASAAGYWLNRRALAGISSAGDGKTVDSQ